MEFIELAELCDKGSSNLAQKDLVFDSGIYPVYGAPGEITKVDFFHQSKPYLGLIKDGAGVGRVMQLPANSSVIGTIQYIFPKEDVDLKYRFDVVKYLDLGKSDRGATIPHIYFKDYKKRKIKARKYSEQKHIGQILELIDSHLRAYKNVLEQYDLLIKSRFVELISNNKLIYQKVRLKDCCLVSSAATPSRKNSDYWDENGINWFKTTELKNNFLFDSDEKISKLGYEKTAVKILPKHTVLIAMYGQGKTRGMTGYLLNNATTNQACAALISLDTINPKYLWYTMINSYDRLRNMAKGGTQPNLSVSLIKDFEIILPPIDIQNKFTNYIEQINKLKSDVQKSIDETQLLMDSLMQEYFG